MKVAEARTKAGHWYDLVKQGIDPEQAEAEARTKIEAARRAEAAKQTRTFGVYAEQYIEQKTNRRRAADAGEIRHMLIPAFGPMPLHLITPRDVREVMDIARRLDFWAWAALDSRPSFEAQLMKIAGLQCRRRAAVLQSAISFENFCLELIHFAGACRVVIIHLIA